MKVKIITASVNYPLYGKELEEYLQPALDDIVHIGGVVRAVTSSMTATEGDIRYQADIVWTIFYDTPSAVGDGDTVMFLAS